MGLGSTLYLPAYFDTTILPSLHHIIATNPKTPNWTLQSHNSMSSRHVKSFSTIRIDLLPPISVTVATSHWFRSPLKAEAQANTVARKEGQLHSQPTRKKRRRKEEPWSKDSNSPKEGEHSSNYKHHSANPYPLSEPPWITTSIWNCMWKSRNSPKAWHFIK